MIQRFKYLFVYSLFSSIVLFSGQIDSVAQSTDELVERLRVRYDQVELLRAEFTQQTTSPFGEELPINRGTLVLEGDRYRVETEVQTFVTNGEVTWIYDSYQNQVLINHFVKDESTFIISDFLDNFHVDYKIVDTSTLYSEGARYHSLRLESLAPSAFFKEVTLSMRDSDDIITRITVLDVNDATLDFSLDDIEINPNIEGDPFVFLPPDDAEIIDLRS